MALGQNCSYFCTVENQVTKGWGKKTKSGLKEKKKQKDFCVQWELRTHLNRSQQWMRALLPRSKAHTRPPEAALVLSDFAWVLLGTWHKGAGCPLCSFM